MWHLSILSIRSVRATGAPSTPSRNPRAGFNYRVLPEDHPDQIFSGFFFLGGPGSFHESHVGSRQLHTAIVALPDRCRKIASMNALKHCARKPIVTGEDQAEFAQFAAD
jgi:hypothetical protein